MNRIYNVFMWAFALTVMIALTVRLTWADTITMADVAMGEYHSGEKEEPVGSDSIKYNECFYSKLFWYAYVFIRYYYFNY